MTTKITIYDAGFTGSGDTVYPPFTFNISPPGYILHLNESYFEQWEYTLEIEKNDSRTITIEIQPYDSPAVRRMWFWIHLEGISQM